jgi:hypothetical protein
VIKRYTFPSIFEEGLRKVANLRHKVVPVEENFFTKLFKIKN